MTNVWGFFYGGLINPDVMRRVGLAPLRQRPAVLPGFEIQIAPLVNLVASPGSVSFGLLFETTHDQLDRVYGQLKARYLPYPVVAYDQEGALVPALCYLLPDIPAAQADADHIAPLLTTATELGFPSWYLARIESYLPPTAS